jgi:sugar lactone lactonase YvrE
MANPQPRLLLEGLKLPESPRWHGDHLWFSDMVGRRVISIALDGTSQVHGEFEDEPSGLGFMPDGTLLVVMRAARQVVRLQEGEVTLHVDLTSIPCDTLNDMVVDGQGRSYVDAVHRRARTNGDDLGDSIVLIEPDGRIRNTTPGLINPNGMWISPDSRTLIVAETNQHRLTAFALTTDGSLGKRRLFADLGEGKRPDGLCGDADGAIWVGSTASGEFLHVAPTGVAERSIDVGDRWGVACALGGPERKTLFMTSSRTTPETIRKEGGAVGYIETLEVMTPGAGWP